MAKRLTIQQAIEEFDLYNIYQDIIELYGEDVEDPSFVSDLYDSIDEYEEEYEFFPDSEGDYSTSFERNLKDAITTIIEESDDLSFAVDQYMDDGDISGIIDDDFKKGTREFEVDLEEDEYSDED